MFERFTERSKRVIFLAEAEARSLDHDFIGTEHLLLGLLAENQGLGGHALISLDLDIESVRTYVMGAVSSSGYLPGHSTPSPPFNQGAGKSLEFALRDLLKSAAPQDDRMIDTDNLLIGILDAGPGVADEIIVTKIGNPDRVRRRVAELRAGLPFDGS